MPEPTATTADSYVADVFTRDTTDPRALILDGHGTSITVRRGQLVLTDGIGPHQRRRTLSRIERTVRRVIVLDQNGYVTTEAIRWCANVGVTIIHARRDGTILGYSGLGMAHDAPLRRAQALVGFDTPAAIEIARMILSCKLNSQADVTETVFLNDQASAAIRSIAGDLGRSRSVDVFRSMEGSAAGLYWQSWVGSACPNWRPNDLQRIPAHWCMFAGRSSAVNDNGRNRGATDPINAALNYGYSVAESACCIELMSCGLDPGFGILHSDRPGRNSLALDILEIVRPAVDIAVIEALGIDRRRDQRYLSTDYVVEDHHGHVRICPPLTHELVEALPHLGSVVQPYLRRIVDVIRATGTGSNGSMDYSVLMNRKSVTRTLIKDEAVTIRGGVGAVIDSVSDELWAELEPLIANPKPVPGKSGRPAVDNRAVLTAILLRMNGYAIPTHLGVGRTTVATRVSAWKRADVWERILRILKDSLGDDA